MNKQLQTKDEAIDTVQNNNEEFYDLAIELARKWVSRQFKSFSSEDFREYSNLILGIPRQPSVFGAVFRTLIKENRVRHHGVGTAKNKQAHGRLIRFYISREYSEKQQQNRKTEKSLDLFKDS
jgi:hypothetical protein